MSQNALPRPSNLADTVKNDSQSLPNEPFMTAHLLDILQFLAKPPVIDDASLAHAHGTMEVNDEPVSELSILLVGAPTLTQNIAKNLSTHVQLPDADTSANNGANNPPDDILLTLHQQDIDTCLTSAFSQRFDLGVLLFEGADENIDLANSSQKIQHIAIKFRDLLAEQSVLYVPNTLDNSFYSLGYVLSDAHRTLTHNIPDLPHDTPNTYNTPWQVWQFNLYDYKPTPNWLNAKYWANPENFGKYRW